MGRGFIQGAQVFKGGAWTPPEAILSPVAFHYQSSPCTSIILELAIYRAGLDRGEIKMDLVMECILNAHEYH